MKCFAPFGYPSQYASPDVIIMAVIRLIFAFRYFHIHDAGCAIVNTLFIDMMHGISPAPAWSLLPSLPPVTPLFWLASRHEARYALSFTSILSSSNFPAPSFKPRHARILARWGQAGHTSLILFSSLAHCFSPLPLYHSSFFTARVTLPTFSSAPPCWLRPTLDVVALHVNGYRTSLSLTSFISINLS